RRAADGDGPTTATGAVAAGGPDDPRAAVDLLRVGGQRDPVPRDPPFQPRGLLGRKRAPVVNEDWARERPRHTERAAKNRGSAWGWGGPGKRPEAGRRACRQSNVPSSAEATHLLSGLGGG